MKIAFECFDFGADNDAESRTLFAQTDFKGKWELDTGGWVLFMPAEDFFLHDDYIRVEEPVVKANDIKFFVCRPVGTTIWWVVDTYMTLYENFSVLGDALAYARGVNDGK